MLTLVISLEALWRESLWLINIDIAKTEDIDELITHIWITLVSDGAF